MKFRSSMIAGHLRETSKAEIDPGWEGKKQDQMTRGCVLVKGL